MERRSMTFAASSWLDCRLIDVYPQNFKFNNNMTSLSEILMRKLVSCQVLENAESYLEEYRVYRHERQRRIRGRYSSVCLSLCLRAAGLDSGSVESLAYVYGGLYLE